MPRKVSKEKVERPAYITSDGGLDFNKIFKFQPRQTELLRTVSRNGGIYTQPVATQCLSVGGVRAGKTCGWLMYGVMHYCLAFKNCDVLVLRRTFPELDKGAIADAKALIPKELYTYDSTKHTITFINGSHIIFGHCEHNKDRDLAKFLGQGYPLIIIDECGQFSPDAWLMLQSRNTINSACEPDEHGNLPIPAMVGCTNPLGPFYEFYRTIFVQQEPWLKPENAKKDLNGVWFVPEAGEWRPIYNPSDYAYQRTTVLDNAELLRRDPGIIARLNSFPKAKRDKMLLGLDGIAEGQYFTNFDPTYHVIDLREDPDQIIFQPHQLVWGAQDWGLGHANSAHLFTKALVRSSIGTDYKLKTVCFREQVTTDGKTHKEWASIFARMAKYPDGTPCKVSAIYFSHEKFSRQVSAHTPADEYSRELRTYGLPAVTRGTQDRIGRAALMYNMLGNGELVILDTCREIILSIPSLMRDPDVLEDVYKTEAKGDDVYDSFSMGLYGQLAAKQRPSVDAIYEHAKTLDPVASFFYKMKKLSEHQDDNVPFRPPEQAVWLSKSQN